MTTTKHPVTRGERFRIRSRRGSLYVLSLVHRGPGARGLIVRTSSGQLARLDPARLDWNTLECDASADETLLRAGDEVLVEAASGTFRGKLTSDPGADLAIEVGGEQRRYRVRTILNLWLLFPASELLPDDVFQVRSLSGREYEGTVLSLEPDGRLRVELDSGDVVTLVSDRFDMATLYLRLPVPRSAWESRQG